MPVAALLLLLLFGGSLRWGPVVPEPGTPVADAGTHEAAAIPNGGAGSGAQDPPADPNHPEDGRLIDGSRPDLVPVPAPPPAEEEPADDPVGRTPAETTPTAEPPVTEEPNRPTDEGPAPEDDEEEPATEDPTDDPGEEPIEREEPVVDPPTIVQFTLTDLRASCEGSGRTTYRFWRVEWRTEDATAVHLDLGAGEGPQAEDPTGMHRRVCLPYGATVELTATNDGGTVSASEEAVPG